MMKLSCLGCAHFGLLKKLIPNFRYCQHCDILDTEVYEDFCCSEHRPSKDYVTDEMTDNIGD